MSGVCLKKLIMAPFFFLPKNPPRIMEVFTPQPPLTRSMLVEQTPFYQPPRTMATPMASPVHPAYVVAISKLNFQKQNKKH